MNHDQIEQFDIVHRYLMGKLSGEEVEQFEEHLIDCPQCVEKLQTIRNFRQGLRAYIMQEAGNADKVPFFLRLFSTKTWAIVGGSLLAASAILLLFAFSHIRHLQKAEAAARQTVADLQRQYNEQRQQATSSDQQHQETETYLREQLQQRETELQRAHQQSTASTNGILASAQPETNLQIRALSAERAGGQNAEEIPKFTQSRSSKNFYVLIPLEGASAKAVYSATVFANQRLIKKITELEPDGDNQLSFKLDSRDFPAGEYRVEVKSEPKQTRSGIFGNYPFRVIRHP
jgi:hypothetical protein